MTGLGAPDDAGLIEVVDRLLGRGVAIRGDLWLTVADVELVYIGAQIVIASPEALSAARTAGGRAAPTDEEAA